MVPEGAALDEVTEHVGAIGRDWDADLLHLNLPSQAAMIRWVSGGGHVAFVHPHLVASRTRVCTATNVAMAANVDQARSHARGRGDDTDHSHGDALIEVLRADGQIACRR